MKLEAGLSRLKECYLFAHLTFSILTITCLLEWLKLTNIYFNSYMFLWVACLIIILALVPAQHKILTKTFYRDFQKLHFYKITYSVAICLIYTPIVTGIFAHGNLSVLIIVPVILNSIICGTIYGMATSLIVTASLVFLSGDLYLIAPEEVTSYILMLAVLITTSWFTGQTFEYIKNLLYQLTESEMSYKSILDNLGIATLYLDGSNCLPEENQRFRELIGKNNDDLSLIELIDRHLPFMKAHLDEAFNNSVGTTIFGQASDGKGKLIPVQCVAYPINRNVTQNKGLVICINDISLSERLEEEKIRTNLFLDFLDSGLMLADAEGNVIEMNRQAMTLLGLERETAIGKNLTAVLPSTMNKEIDLFKLKQSGFEIQMGSSTLLVNCADLRKNNNKVIGSICIINDITEQKELEKKLHRSATLSAIGELAAGTAHEIRNPLTSIKGFLQLLIEKSDAKIGDYNNYLVLMVDEVNHINSIITEFLKLAKPNKPTLSLINLNDVIQAIWELLKNEASIQGIKLDLELKSDSNIIMGNVDSLKQVILNLVSNAFQAAGANGSVKVTVSKNENDVLLSIQDNGPGIDEAILPKIFDPFFTTRDEGTGLGLAITSKIVDEHNAVINAVSSPSQGTTFNIKFPLLENAAA